MDLAIGQVFKLYCATCRKQKHKFFVIALIEPRLCCFLINSALTSFQESRDVLRYEAVPLEADQHDFLTHDSYLGCNELFVEYTEKALQHVVDAQPNLYVGQLHYDAIIEARERFPDNVSLPRSKVIALIDTWKDL